LLVGPASVGAQQTNPSELQAIEIAREFLREHHQSLGMLSDVSDLETLSVSPFLGGRHVRFGQVHSNVSVIDGTVNVTVDREGFVSFMSNGYQPSIRVESVVPTVDSTTAVQTVEAVLGRIRQRKYGGITLNVFRDVNGSDHLVWHFVAGGSDFLPYETLVDARSGAIVSSRPAFAELVTGQANVYVVDPATELEILGPGDGCGCGTYRVRPLPELLNAAGGFYKIRGRRWKSDNLSLGAECGSGGTNDPGINPISVPEAQGPNFYFGRTEPGFEEANIYFHFNTFWTYLADTLGLSGLPSEVFFDAHNHKELHDRYAFIPPNRHEVYLCETSRTDSANCGTVLEDFPDGGEDQDVIIHEFAHAVTRQKVQANLVSGEPAELREGYADYCAVSYRRAAEVELGPLPHFYPTSETTLPWLKQPTPSCRPTSISTAARTWARS
jgi:hypothetical protein